MAALDGAVALEEVDAVAVRVAEHLHLDVAGALDQLFQIHLVLAEGGLRLALRLRDVADQRRRVADDAHAAPAAAPRGLQHHRVADRLGRGLPASGSSGSGSVAGMTGTPRGDGQLARRDLVAEPAHRLRRRADEGDAGGGAGLGEFRAFGEQPVARMDGVGARALRDAQDLRDGEIRLDRPERALQMRPAADLVGLVRLEAVQRELVFLREQRRPS